MRYVSAITALTAALSLAACNGGSSTTSTTTTTATSESGTINIAGSTALLPLVKQAAQDYQAKNANEKISVSGGGSRVGLTQAANKGVDIGDSDIPPAPDQSSLMDHQVAVVVFAVATNPKLGIKNLTKKQIQDIFSGKDTNWSQLGGPSQKITIINRPKSSGTRAVFVKNIMDGKQPTDAGLTQDSSGTVVTVVGQTPGAVTYVSTGYIKNGNVTAVSIDGTPANDANVTSGKYPFWSYEHMVTSGEPRKDVADFIDFVSKDTDTLKKFGFLATSAMKTGGK